MMGETQTHTSHSPGKHPNHLDHLVVSLNWGLNLLVKSLKKPSNELHVSFSACVHDSMNCRPFLFNQFFTTASCSV